MNNERHREIVAAFNLLKDWTIECDLASEYKGQCSFDPTTKRAVIYGWSGGKEPDDYFLHEILHVLIKDVVYSHATTPYKVAREREELLVRDICKYIRESKCTD